MTRIRSFDLTANNLTTQTVDTILEDLLINYNNAPRSGVTINLAGTGMGPPSSNPVVTPTSSTTKVGEETIVVNQDPLNPTLIFDLQTLNIRNDTVGTSPNDTISVSYTHLTLPTNSLV